MRTLPIEKNSWKAVFANTISAIFAQYLWLMSKILKFGQSFGTWLQPANQVPTNWFASPSLPIILKLLFEGYMSHWSAWSTSPSKEFMLSPWRFSTRFWQSQPRTLFFLDSPSRHAWSFWIQGLWTLLKSSFDNLLHFPVFPLVARLDQLINIAI